MSSPRSLDDLFSAARADAPSREVQDEVWGRVAATAAAPAAVVASKAAAAAVKTSLLSGGAKLLAVGAVIGAAGATTIVVLGSSSPPAPSAAAPGPAHRAPRVRAAAVGSSGDHAGARLADEEPRPRTGIVPASRAAGDARVTDAAPVVFDGPGPTAKGSQGSQGSDSLAQEAALVTEARAALLRGDPERALLLARSSSALPTRALEPEELTLEARALRALGRTDDAENVENALRRRFPENSLAHPKTK